MGGLAVYGTITKTAVATGAELMGYSGFSASNYLEQPYSADLDFSTGDFSVMGWVRPTVSTPYNMLFSRGASTTDDVYIYNDGGTLKAKVVASGVIGSGGTLVANAWQHVALIRKSGIAFLYLNTAQVGSVSSPHSVTNTTATLVLGARVNKSLPASFHSLALWRISATAPSDAQLLEIYNAELPLFQDRAACTLYGASDAVTALAHDDALSLLHVGTSAGRSVFSGLERKYNTTDAVSTTISVENGLVAEK